jgi:RNA polymerase sigma factor (sigma-70 family)
MIQSDKNELIELALQGNQYALEKLLTEVQHLVFNLSLRMLGTISDAEDASQEILVRVMTNLSSFRKESRFTTWVYRIAVNYLLNYKKSMFAQRPLSFEMYGQDIEAGFIDHNSVDLKGVDEDMLADELKMSCTNVMLQCLDPQSRSIYILGTMFQIDSKTAGEMMGLTSQNYRQKLSRSRRKMGDFLSAYCGLSKTGQCDCKKRIGFALQQKRLDPSRMQFCLLEQLDHSLLLDCKDKMEQMDQLSGIFNSLPQYKATKTARDFLRELLKSANMESIQSCGGTV